MGASTRSPGRAAERFFDARRLGRAVESWLATHPDARGTLRVHTPAPAMPVEEWLRLAPRGTALLWAPERSEKIAGIGAAISLELDSRERGLASLDRAAVRALGESFELALDRTDPPPVRFYGGLAFAPGVADEHPWTGFGDGRFILPRWLYRRSTERATLTLSLCLPGDRAKLAELVADYGRLGARWCALAPCPPAPAADHAESDARARSRWTRDVEQALADIAARRLEKVVLARRHGVTFDGPFEPAGLLSRLAAASAETTLFALRIDGATFLGATPERLVSRHAARVTSMALAGSAPRRDARGAVRESGAVRLLASEKDCREHALVVEAIRVALADVTRELSIAPRPNVLELEQVLHLSTPIEGVLAEPLTALELVERLHPTPAVGGHPRAAALEWLARHENCARGWYAAPFGWFAPDGNGEFVVALRSGLFSRERGWLYAGAGLVSGSLIEEEYDETLVKLQPLLTALGIHA
ncbi:MAG: isochorismate synthase [Acidobacteriota bacterium]|nr:MAG: isochorismate synthase [Acidobacteriota bacterium]